MSHWMVVASKDDVQDNHGIQVIVEGKVLALFKIKGQYFAIDDACSHAGGSLAEGPVVEGVVTCPWHGATFDIVTGEALSEPANEGVKSYLVKVEGNDIYVQI